MKYLAVVGYFFLCKTNACIEFTAYGQKKKTPTLRSLFQSNYRQAAALIPALVPK